MDQNRMPISGFEWEILILLQVEDVKATSNSPAKICQPKLKGKTSLVLEIFF